MAIDYAEKEREFLDSLAADTGRDLAQWMDAIRDSGHTDRNDIIDWLRQQGFLFAKASWMERIHHNGGKPVYGGSVPVPPPRVTGAELLPALPTAPVIAPTVARTAALTVVPAVVAAPPASVATPAPPAADLESLLAEAKAYRPLAWFVLREIKTRLPDAAFEARPGYVSLTNGGEFGIVSISPRELRLALVWPQAPVADPYTRARFPKSHPEVPPGLTHMCVLTDARQVTEALMDAVAAAATPRA
jgi:hypothetical protein